MDNDDEGKGSSTHIRVTLLNMGYSNMLSDPLTGVPAGLLTIARVGAIVKHKYYSILASLLTSYSSVS